LTVDFALARELLAAVFFVGVCLVLTPVPLIVAFVFFATGLAFLALVFGFVVFVTFVNVFDLPFDAFFDVIFDREEDFVAPLVFGLGLAPILAFLGLALVDGER
jgi:hypothetical protein